MFFRGLTMSKDNTPSTGGVQLNKRKNLRSPILTLRVKLDDGQKVFFGYAKNISATGMFITSINPKEPGQAYQVEIPLPAPIRYRALGAGSKRVKVTNPAPPPGGCSIWLISLQSTRIHRITNFHFLEP